MIHYAHLGKHGCSSKFRDGHGSGNCRRAGRGVAGVDTTLAKGMAIAKYTFSKLSLIPERKRTKRLACAVFFATDKVAYRKLYLVL
ncbi:hypothetical protein NPIL_306301 [Nephila pilipes]|uniref:Uncharacterized protein n=1 Tax=Nephila pilipes TaxID=299642 RepID=A0A8X6NK74_NEPPI|nr:hypothetical protein NPIL_306301 [Nephila pilipes]